MDVTATRRRVTFTPPALALLAGAGQAAALLATYWDDSWHTDEGRDEFLIPPHLLLYGGVALASLCIAAWGLLAWSRVGWGVRGVREVLRDPALLLAGLGGVVTLASGPVDGAWHAAFGRDAVIWSPPHLTAVLGTTALSVGLLAGLRGTAGRTAVAARVVAAAGIVGTLQVPVLEYDSDVPQFSTLWFLPVAALGIALAVALLDDLLDDDRLALAAGAVYTALRVVTVGVLAALGMSLTVVPPVVLAFVVARLLRERPPALRLVLTAAAVPLLWWPFLELQAGVTTTVPIGELLASVPLAALGGGLVALVHGDLRPRGASAAVAVSLTVLLVPVVDAPPAAAHDPGQGPAARAGELVVERVDGRATVELLLPDGCDDVQPVRVLARRAGTTEEGPLEPAGGCAFTGEVEGLTDGRWFVYAELRSADGQVLETWAPSLDGKPARAVRPLYVPAEAEDTSTRDLAGGVLLLLAAALVTACLRLARRSRALAEEVSR